MCWLTWRRARRAISGTVLALIAALGTPAIVPPVLAQAPPSPPAGKLGRGDDLMIVDCLLPSQIRRLGRQLLFLGPRRPVKTSAADCEIRGGEYVAWDRANYATALKIWLPLANEGDVLAQTYVGEIHEKGLGTAPDHAEAARWYRRAAEGGSARAAVNLGYLYEQGLGVARDARAAAAWYKRAAGPDGAAAVVEPASEPASQGPTIELLDPERLVVRGEVVREFPIQPSIDRIVLSGRLIDGEKITVNDREQALGEGKRFRSSIPVPVPGDRVTISAIDASGRRSDLALLVRTRPALTEKGVSDLKLGRYHALVIGNDDYRQLPRLRTASRDAREVARVLQDDYGFAVTLLVNASRYDILSTLNDLRQRLRGQDNLLVFYSGHGEMNREGQHGYWLPVDAEPNAPATWISSLALTEFLNAMDVRQVLIAADSCFAGAMSRSSVSYMDFEGGAPDTSRIEALAKRRSRLVMTSGGCRPTAPIGEPPHSAFARSFIDVLRGNGGVLPGQEMFRLLRVRLSATTVAEHLPAPSAPVYGPLKYAGHEAGDFVFVRAAARR
jgi:hypothetical protein